MTGSYSFTLGRFSCLAVSDGSLDYPLDRLFANAPREQVEAILRERRLPTDRVTTPYTFLFVDTGTHRVLIDMGGGTMAPSTGRLLANLRAAGQEPQTIDTVVITHAHPDHIGGTLDARGELSYPDARYVISAPEWTFWFSDEAPSQAPAHHVRIARENLEPLRDRMELLEGEAEVVPGVRLVPAPGHTPGHAVVEVGSEGEQLVYASDTVLYPLHLEHPDWVPIYDVQPEEAAASKRRVFDRAARDGALVLGMHFPPFPSLGRVTKKGAGWSWEPLELSA